MPETRLEKSAVHSKVVDCLPLIIRVFCVCFQGLPAILSAVMQIVLLQCFGTSA